MEEREVYAVPKTTTTAAKRGKQNAQRGKAFERAIAKETGGRRVPLSGGGSYKGDVTTRYVLLECKTSARVDAKGERTFTLPEEFMVKAAGEARDEGKLLWALPFHYKGSKHNWVVMDWAQVLGMFKQLAYLYSLFEGAGHHGGMRDALACFPPPADMPPVGLPLFSCEEP